MVQTLLPPTARSARRGRRLSYFAWHFVEMCAAMCIAWMLVSLPFLGLLRSFGVDTPVQDLPELTTIVAAAAMSAGMAADMLWRGHGWRCIGEMTEAMAIEAVVLIALAGLGVFPRSDLFAWYHALMPVAMIGAMLYRFDLYASPPTRRRSAAAQG